MTKAKEEWKPSIEEISSLIEKFERIIHSDASYLEREAKIKALYVSESLQSMVFAEDKGGAEYVYKRHL